MQLTWRTFAGGVQPRHQPTTKLALVGMCRSTAGLRQAEGREGAEGRGGRARNTWASRRGTGREGQTSSKARALRSLARRVLVGLGCGGKGTGSCVSML